MTLQEFIAKSREIEGGATPGLWIKERRGDGGFIVECGDSTGWKKAYPNSYIAEMGGWGYAMGGNGPFIVHSRNVHAKLLKIIEVQAGALDAIKEEGIHPEPDSFSRTLIHADFAIEQVNQLVGDE